MGLHRVCAVALCAVVAAPMICAAQQIDDTEPRAEEARVEMEKAEPEKAAEVEKPLFILNHVPPLAKADGALDKLDALLPLKFGVESQFLSNWLNEGGNWAKNGVQIMQTYYTEFSHDYCGGSAGVGFSYFQIDTTYQEVHPSTLERDFTVYAPLSWKKFSLEPYWTYIYVDGAKDYNEIGSEFSIDIPLKPTFVWNHDFSVYTGTYYEWSISHDIDIAPNGERLFVFTPSMAMGMDAHKYQEGTTLTHIDWGLELGIPVMKHFVVSGAIHFTKSLTHATYDEDNDVFEDVIPWGGLKLTMEF